MTRSYVRDISDVELFLAWPFAVATQMYAQPNNILNPGKFLADALARLRCLTRRKVEDRFDRVVVTRLRGRIQNGDSLQG